MPSGDELKKALDELRAAGVSGREAAETILSQDYDTPTGELSRILEMKSKEVGRIKGVVKMRLQAEARQMGVEPAATVPPPPATPPAPPAATPPAAAPPAAAAPPTQAVEAEEGPSVVAQFKESIERVIHRGGTGWREHLVHLFERKAHQLRSRDSLVSWLVRMGVTGYEAEMVAEEIAPAESLG